MARVPAELSQLTLRDYLVPVRERVWLILAIVIVVTGGVYAYYARKAHTYSAATKVFVGQAGVPALGFGSGVSTPTAVADQATLLTSTEVSRVVARRIGFKGSAAALAGSVTATPSTTTDFITITARESSAAGAAHVANAFAREFIARNSAQQAAATSKAIAQLRRQLAQLAPGPASSTERASIEGQLQQAQIAATSGVGNVTQVDAAEPPGAPDNRPPLEYAGLAAIAALIGSILLAYALHRLDPRLKTVEQAAMIYGQPILATVMHDRNIDHFVDGMPSLSDRSRESFRDLRVSLDLAAPDRYFATILVTSAASGEGKSTVARNLALALSEAGRRVALLDADLRKPGLPKILGVTPTAGLVDVLAGASEPVEATTVVAIAERRMPGADQVAARFRSKPPEPFAAQPSLTFIASGTAPANPPAVFESAAFRSLLAEVREAYDVVIIDTTPLTAVSDAIPMLAQADAVLLVARSGTTDRRSARHAAELIARVPGTNVVGVVVNDLPAVEATAYGTGYGYGYGYPKRDATAAKPSQPVVPPRQPATAGYEANGELIIGHRVDTGGGSVRRGRKLAKRRDRQA